MENSILKDIKKLLGVIDDYFDTDIIIFINTAFTILHQIGVGPKNGFSIEDDVSKWSDFTNDNKLLEPVKSYIFFKVKLAFDPPISSITANAYEKAINELEWRLNVNAETEIKNE